MILRLDPLPKIPYVDGIPLDTVSQTSINWIINGQSLFGAKEKLGNDGNLNTHVSQVQKNAVRLELNDGYQVSKINEIVDQVNLISSNLDGIASQDVIKTLNKATTDIGLIKVDLSVAKTDIAQHTLLIGSLNTEIGEYDVSKDPKHRTIRDDIIFIKKEMGAYSGYNQNGDSDPLSDGFGMKYKIMQNANAVSKQEGRIVKLEDDWANSEVGQLTQTVTDLRNEVGLRGMATQDSLYVRLNKTATHLADIDSEIAELNEYVGRSGGSTDAGLVGRVIDAEKEIGVLQVAISDPTTGLGYRTTQLENALGSNQEEPGSLRNDIVKLKRSVIDISLIMGDSSDDGLRGDVTQALSDIGSDSDPTSIKGRVLTIENASRDMMADIDDVKGVVGNSTSGLVAANVTLGKDIYGDATGADKFTKDGIKKTLKDVVASLGGGSGDVYALITALTNRITALEKTVADNSANLVLLNQMQIK